MYKKLLLATLFLALSQALAAGARACSCTEYGTPVCAAYWRADAVFTGVITDFSVPHDAGPSSLPKALLHFRVEDKLKNISAAEVDVETLHGTSCDMTFEKGERWLVYAYTDKETGRLEISPCTRTGRLSGMDDELSYLLGMGRRPPEQSVLGRLTRFQYDPLADVKVTVSGGGESFETTTDSGGNFAVPLPRGGAYTVRALVPYSADAMSYTAKVTADPSDAQTVLEYPVEIPAGQCAYSELDVYKVDLHATAEVSGKVIDESGQPVTRGYVHLVDAAPKDGTEPRSVYTKISEGGAFKFEGVPVGSFVLVINPRDEAPDEYDAPNPRTFYPGASERGQASPLVITEGLKLDDITFRVRGPMRKRVVSGRVLTPGGKPAPEALVSLYDGDKHVLMVKADAGGRFTMDVYGDFDYRVDAEVFGEKRFKSEKVKVPPTAKPAPLTLKLKPQD